MPTRSKKKAAQKKATSEKAIKATAKTEATAQPPGNFVRPGQCWADLFKTEEQLAKIKQVEEKAKQNKQAVFEELLQNPEVVEETTLTYEPIDPFDEGITSLQQAQIENRKTFAMAGAAITGLRHDLTVINAKVTRLEALLEVYLNGQSTSSQSQPSALQPK